MSGIESMTVLLPEGGAMLLDPHVILRPSELLKPGPGELRRVEIRTTRHAGYLVLLDAFDCPSNGDRKPLEVFEVKENNCYEFEIDPPIPFRRACLAVFSLTPWPKLTPSPTAYFVGDCR